MTSKSGQTTVVFNGELYNTDDLTSRFVPNETFRTTSDTEVFLESFERSGETVFSACNGMFGAAFYDTTRDELTLVRDRMGKKPLYLLERPGLIAFASELRALQGFQLNIEPESAPFFFHFGYLPSPHTFFEDVTQVRPGESVVLRRGRVVRRVLFHQPKHYVWDDESNIDADGLNDLVDDAVRRRTVSDVPVGTFLSGGVDSSLVASSLVKVGQADIPTFTVAFDDQQYDESAYAADVAHHLGLKNETIRITNGELLRLVDDFVDCYEQPYADTSGLPTMALCRAVRQHVTVALAGDGGDEFFGGYSRYDWLRKAASAMKMPRWLRRLGTQLVRRSNDRRSQRVARLLSATDDADLYCRLLQTWHGGALSDLLPGLVAPDERPLQLVRDVFDQCEGGLLAKAACFDATYYIPDDLQPKVDRASMRYSLEVRCPLLDFRVAALGASIATSTKFAGGKKSLLKTLLRRSVPETLIERPKKGFSVPMSSWIRGPLRDVVHDTIRSRSLRDCGWLDWRTAERQVREFGSGRDELATHLWMLFVLARTLEKAKVGRADQLDSHRRLAS